MDTAPFWQLFSVWDLSLERFSYWKTSSNVQLLYNVQCTVPPFGKFYTFAILVYVHHRCILSGSQRTSFANPNKSFSSVWSALQCHRQPVPGPGHGHRQLQVRHNKPVLLFICLVRCSVIGNLFLALVTATVSFRLHTIKNSAIPLLYYLEIAGQVYRDSVTRLLTSWFLNFKKPYS